MVGKKEKSMIRVDFSGQRVWGFGASSPQELSERALAGLAGQSGEGLRPSGIISIKSAPMSFS